MRAHRHTHTHKTNQLNKFKSEKENELGYDYNPLIELDILFIYPFNIYMYVCHHALVE